MIGRASSRSSGPMPRPIPNYMTKIRLPMPIPRLKTDIGKRVDVVDIDTNTDTDLFVFKSLHHYSIIYLCLRVDELTKDVLDVY